MMSGWSAARDEAKPLLLGSPHIVTARLQREITIILLDWMHHHVAFRRAAESASHVT